ncbi:CDP-glycerol glycerophosphotransferase family protein [Microbacterium sp.]|uniref:bifunctional glycosyltransferase/CDP-glycerol:glycerophosphate glycerophosphotransferase n=1 Tax=Microbacterium sp. TaxID=51671 RepID=UPI0037353184
MTARGGRDWRSRVPDKGLVLGRQVKSFGLNARVRGRAAVRRRSGQVPGLLSFIVPVYNVEEYLDECLHSLRFQAYRDVEIICVDDGSPDDSVSIVRKHRLKDPRVRLVRRPNGGLSAARNTGVAAARGEYIAFVDSDDTVPPDGYLDAVQTLGRSGSDFAVLPYQRLKRKVISAPAPWIRAIHASERIGVHIDEAPDALANAIMCSKVFRTDFWHRLGLSFVEGIIYEDQQVSAEAYARAHAFDILMTPLYNWRMRLDRSSISQAKHEVDNLRAQFAAANESLEVLRRHASEAVVTERIGQLLSNDMPQFTQLLVDASDDFWELLREELPLLVDALDGEEYLARVPPQQKVLQHLILVDRRAHAEEFIRRGGLQIRDARLGEEEVGLVAYLPLWRDADAGVPDECFRVAERQTRLRTSIRGVAVTGPRTLQLRAWAYIENVDLAERTPQVQAVAVGWRDGRATGEEIALEARPVRDVTIDEYAATGSAHADYRNGGAVVDVDLDLLGPGTWRVRLEVEVEGQRRSDLLANAWQVGTASLRHAATGQGGRPVTVVSDRRGPVEIRVYDDGVVATSVQLGAGDVRIEGTGTPPDEMALRAGRNGKVATATPQATANGWAAVLRLPAPPDPTAAPPTWEVTARRGGEAVPVRWAPTVAESADVEDVRVLAGPTDDGRLTLSVHPEVAVMRSATVHDDRLVLTVDTAGFDHAAYDVVFASRPATVQGSAHDLGDGRVELVLPFRETRWGKTDQVIRSATYTVAFMHPETGRRITPRVTPPLLWQLPIDELTDLVRCRVQLRPGVPTPEVLIGPPLPVEERGMRNQLQLQALANHGLADEHAVFFRSLYGEVANDSAAAVHHELRARGSDLTMYWSVADYSVEVPEGGVPLLEGTREWHERLGAAQYVMVNVHQPSWYRKPAGQVMIQTFHGYPYKGMGQEWWVRSGLPTARITSFLDRAEDWDHLVSPAAYATPQLLTAFFRPEAAKAVEVLEIGYPRNDVLLSERGEQVRAETRRALGIAPHQKAILYAPTFRDYFSEDGMTARAVQFFDPRVAAAALGEDYVILVRGHAFNARARESRVAGDRIIDVTYHPDVSDLILASDAGVLDYSSLRFDYALTRKPMVFLVPDEDEYHRNRPSIMPFPPTAPGPRVATNAEVVRLLQDLDGLRQRYADDVERFIAQYCEREDGHAAARLVDAVFEEAGDRVEE